MKCWKNRDDGLCPNICQKLFNTSSSSETSRLLWMLTLNLKAANLNTNSIANTAVKMTLRISRNSSYGSGWLWNFIAKVMVFNIIRMKIVYSKGCDVTNHQILYWIRCFGMYRRTGFAFKANSMQFLCNTAEHQIEYLITLSMNSISAQKWNLIRPFEHKNISNLLIKTLTKP